ncbi:MAG TPA: HAMP domain-containing sensor histidine kinase, partial [Actinomycetes bacterium]|nr:HAMP domain-containing sensor histidine kinase [Actinomycetes bacterium]
IGGNATKGYSGPDRRGTPAAEPTVRVPWGSRRRASLLILTGVGAVAALAVALSGTPTSTRSLAQLAALVTTLLTVAAAIALLVSSRVGGHAPQALVGVGLMVLALAGLPGLPDPDGLLGLVGLLAAGLALVRALRAPAVDATIRPWRLLASLLAAVAVIALGLTLLVTLIERAGLVDAAAASARPGVLADLGSAGCAAALAAAFVRRPSALARWQACGLAAGFATLAASELVSVAADRPVLGALAAEVAALGALVLLAVGALSLRQSLAVQRVRAAWLRTQLRQRQALDRHRSEVLHDARSVLAGIRSARSTLTRYTSLLDPAGRAELETAMEAELARLGRLLDRDKSTAAAPGSYDVVRALEPLVVAARQRGLDVTVTGDRTTADGDPDILAEIVGNLLDNTLTHAPGARAAILVDDHTSGIRVSVIDDGPGIPSELRDSIFQPGPFGPRPAGAPGHGLGLASAHRLADQQGGGLELIDTTDGAWFVIRLRRAVAPAAPSDGTVRARDGV